MHIRPATPADCAIIAEFNIRLAWETERLALNPATVNAGVAALLADPAKGLYWVAERPAAEGTPAEIVGQIMITYEWSDWRNGVIWWIQSVYVRESARGRGVFTALYRHLEALARARPEVCTLRLYMERDNTTARRTYTRLGMVETHYQVFEQELRT